MQLDNDQIEEVKHYQESSLYLLDTSGCSMFEQVDSENGSKYNIGEASLVNLIVQNLKNSKVEPK